LGRARGDRVLISAEELTGGLAAVRALRAAGYEPWAALTRPGRAVEHSRSLGGAIVAPDPAVDPERFAHELSVAARDLDVAAVLPGSEESLLALANHGSLFSRVAVGADAPETVERALDKLVVGHLATSAGMQVLPTTTIEGHELRARSAEFGYPIVLKPERTKIRGSDGVLRRVPVHYVRNEGELERILAPSGNQTWLLQPFVPGSLAAVCGVAWNGELMCATHQVAARIWPPDCGISAYASTVHPDASREAAVGRLLSLIGLSGIFQAQFVRVGEDWAFIDLNPRVYGSLALAVAAGLNLPAIWTDLLLGRVPEIGPYRVGVGYRAEGNDARWIAHNLRRGRLRAGATGLLPRHRTVHALFSIRDPLPALKRAFAIATRSGPSR
jgi:predicted ATP-grasp superfamily ATP-dependent carboligase